LALAAVLVFAAWYLASPGKLGFGDVRMAALVSAGTGAVCPAGCLVVLPCACLVTALSRKVLIKTGRASGDYAAPLGLPLAIAGVLAVVASAS
jgi:hypothetical protein